MTRAGVALRGTPEMEPPEAQMTPARISAVVPLTVPSLALPMARTCWTLTRGATPTTPMPLLEIALIVPATCRPWLVVDNMLVGSGSRPLPSRALPGLEIMSYPGTVWPTRSGCVDCPESTTATTSEGSPRVTVQAALALMPYWPRRPHRVPST